MEIAFSDPTIPEPARAELQDVLRGIACEQPGFSGDRTGRWVEPVERINVLRRIAGGRSGADVLDVELERSPNGGRTDRRVIKIDAFADVRKEWHAFRDHLSLRHNALITPVDAVSRRVLDSTAEPASQDRAAIVYYHAADYAASPDQAAGTLEDLVRSSLQDEDCDSVVAVLDALLARLTASFYSDAKPTTAKRTLLSLNRGLGQDITLEVDRAAGPSVVKYGDPIPEALNGMRRYAREVLAAATAIEPATSADRRIAIGDTVHLSTLTEARPADEGLIATFGEATVRVCPADPAHQDLRLPELCKRETFEVIGRVTGLRVHDHWARVKRVWPGVEVERGMVGEGDLRVEHPFRFVHRLLTEDVANRVTALIHGDLNPRNVLQVGSQIFLIDFAMTRPNQPLLADFAWLELCLMRDVIAPELDWPAMVSLQRTLAVACRLDAESVGTLLDGKARTAFAVLWAIRRRARASYPKTGRQPWWRDYLTQLTLAGCRTLKWPDDEHSADSVQATVACCGVAAERLSTRPYRGWPSADVTALIRHVVPRLPAGDAQALAELVIAMDGLRDQPDDLWHILETARKAITISAYATDALQILANLREDHELFIKLHAHVPAEETLQPAIHEALLAESAASQQTESDRSSDIMVTKGRARRLPESFPWTLNPRYGFGRLTAPRGRAPAEEDVLRLVTARSRIVVLGSAGSGKSTVARELRFQLATAVHEAATNKIVAKDSVRPLMPILVRASDVVQAIEALGPDASPGDVLRTAAGPIQVPDAMLTIGAVHLAVDAFNELTADSKETAAAWVRALSREFRHTPILVCHRTFEYEAEILPYPLVVLRQLTEDQARQYIGDMLRLSKVDSHLDRSAELSRMLFDNPEHAQVQDLARTPLFLWMIVRRYADTAKLPSNIGALFEDFARWYIEERHHRKAGEQVKTWQFQYEDKVRALEILGRYLVEHGNITEIDESLAVAELTSAQPLIGDVVALLDEIAGSEMLWREAGSLRFLHQSFQEYFAARVFAREAGDEKLLRDRAMIFAWLEPLRIMLGFSGDRPELTERLIQIALRASPLFAAKLLRASETQPRAAVETFIAAQHRTLTARDAGEHDWRLAADALADYASPAATGVLHDVATGNGQPAVRLIAFEALVGSPADLTVTVDALLAENTPIALRSAAINAVGVQRLRAMTIKVGDLVDDQEDWTIVSAAVNALEMMNVDMGRARSQAYARACEKRLLAVEQRLRDEWMPSADAMHELERERDLLVRTVADIGRIDLLLPRRFRYGLAELAWEDWLDLDLLKQPLDDGRLSPAVRRLLTGDLDSAELMATFADPAADDLLVIAAGHRLFTDVASDDVPITALIEAAKSNMSGTRLLMVAAVVWAAGSSLDTERELPAVESLIWDVIAQYSDDLLEPFAALLRSLDSHRQKQSVLAIEVLMALHEKHIDDIVNRWPLYSTWLSLDANAADLNTLLTGDRRQTWAAICYLSRDAYILDAAQPTKVLLTESAGRAFDAFAEIPDLMTTYDPISVFMACAVAHKQGYVDKLIATALDPDLDQTPDLVMEPDFGMVEISGLALLLSALGYLGRVEYSGGDTAAAQRAHDFLRQFDSNGLHHSVERACLAGLGYLGDWIPVLSALDSDDPVIHQMARNTINLWIPGPFSPAGYQGAEQIAGWVAAQLADQSRDLSARHRSTLSAIKEQLESQLGRYVVPDEQH